MGGGGSKQQSQTVIENELINETTKNVLNCGVNRPTIGKFDNPSLTRSIIFEIITLRFL